MRKNMVCFFIAAILLTAAFASVPRALSQTQGPTQNVKILSYSYYIDTAGFFDVVGEVQNVGSYPLSSIILTGSVFSSDGADQADSYCSIGIEQMGIMYLSPQQKAPFYMTFPSPNSNSPDGGGNWYSVQFGKVSLTVAQVNATGSYLYPDLKITSSTPSVGSGSDDYGVYWVNGNVENTGSQTAQNATVFATFYNSTGAVVAVGYSNTITSLGPSGSGSNTASFKLGAFDLNQTLVSSDQKISSYSLLIAVVDPILQGTAPVVTPYTNNSGSVSNPTSAPTSDSSGSSPGNNSAQGNNQNSPLSPTLIAIIAVIVVVAAAGALMAIRRSKPNMTTKEKIKSRR